MTLLELFKAIKEKDLTKTELEEYRNQMSGLLSEMFLEMADLEKEEAGFLYERAENESIISRKVAWKATTAGKHLIVLKRYASATKTMMTSLRDRLYNFY